MSELLQKQEELKRLILEAKSGNDKAFEQIYSSYYTPLYRYILSRIKHKDEATDMTQNVFIKIWGAIPNWNENHTSPLSFFFTVARNSMIDYFRKNSHREIVSDEIVGARAEAVAEKENFDDSDLHEVLFEVVARLSEEQQEVINLFYVSDMSYKEISEITGKREDAIRQVHSRAIKKLRELYKN